MLSVQNLMKKMKPIYFFGYQLITFWKTREKSKQFRKHSIQPKADHACQMGCLKGGNMFSSGPTNTNWMETNILCIPFF